MSPKTINIINFPNRWYIYIITYPPALAPKFPDYKVRMGTSPHPHFFDEGGHLQWIGGFLRQQIFYYKAKIFDFDIEFAW